MRCGSCALTTRPAKPAMVSDLRLAGRRMARSKRAATPAREDGRAQNRIFWARYPAPPGQFVIARIRRSRAYLRLPTSPSLPRAAPTLAPSERVPRRRGTRCPARFTEQPHAAAKGFGPRLASHRPGTGPNAAGHQPRAGVWSPCVTGRLAPTARAGIHLPWIGCARTTWQRRSRWSGQQLLNRALQVGQRLAIEPGAIGDPCYA